ncbi:MAG: PPC domain-containing protein [Chthoniobacteraceae bacterium]
MTDLRAIHAIVLAASLALAGAAAAAEPKLTHLFPVAGVQGSATPVAALGGFDPWPPRVWVSSPGIEFKPGEKAPDFQVEIAAGAQPGPRLVRFYNESGASAPRFFFVTDKPDVLEAEPNNEFTAPQKITALPAVVSGRLDQGQDVDSYAVELKSGQTLVASLYAYRLGSTFDGMLRIVDPAGAQHVFNHDAETMDPFVAWAAPKDGTYIVQVMGFVYPANAEVRFTSGEGCVYRLHLTASPRLQHAVPMAVTRGTKMPVQLVGWNLKAKTAEVDATAGHANESSIAVICEQDLPLQIPLSDYPELAEPCEEAAEPLTVPVPGAVSGCVDRSDDQDHYLFAARKQQIYRIKLHAASAGSSLDGWLRIKDQSGKELAAADDHKSSRDPEIAWTAPADGIYQFAIGDVTHRGGGDFFYRAVIEEESPGVSATAAEHQVKVEAGKSTEMKVTIKLLHGFSKNLRLGAKDVPQGVSVAELDVPEKGGEVAVKFEATADAAPAGAPFQFVLREVEGGKEHPVNYSLVDTSENNGVPQGYSTLVIESTDQLWLTVTKPAAK